MILVGFTGTRRGMTQEQKDGILEFLLDVKATELHHGDCVGADEEVHQMAVNLGIRVVIHPPDDIRYRAFCKAWGSRRPAPYIERNHVIVDECDYLVAAPGSKKELLRSGTWATVRYARKVGRKTVIYYPDGTTTTEVA